MKARVVQIDDPISKRPLVKIRNPQLPLKGYTCPNECINLQNVIDQGSFGIDFGFDCVDLSMLKEKQSIEAILSDLATKPRESQAIVWNCMQETLELRRKYN